MFLTDGSNIKIPRADSAHIRFTLLRDDGETPYLLRANESVRLDVFPVRGAQSVIAKSAGSTAQSPDGSVVFTLSVEDTDIPAGVYRYSLRLTGDEECDTVLGFPDDACFAVGMNCDAYKGSACAGDIIVTVGQAGGTLPPYEGEYTVAPGFDSDIVLETAQKALTENITVERVPITRTENSAGGITLTIGGQT